MHGGMWTVLASVCNQQQSWETFFGSTPRLRAPSRCLWSDLIHFTQSQSINHMEIYVRIIARQWARGAYRKGNIVRQDLDLDRRYANYKTLHLYLCVCVCEEPPHSLAINLFYFYCCSSSRTFWLEVSQVIADGFISSYNIFLKFITIVNWDTVTVTVSCDWLFRHFRFTQKSETQSALKPQRISLLI